MIKFRMIDISVPQFAILAEEPPKAKLICDIGLGFRYAKEQKRIATELKFSYEDEQKRPVIILVVNCVFEINPADWDNSIKDGKLTLDKNILGYFASQTVGVTRGILYERTNGTPFNSLILPPINLTKMLNDDLVIPLD